MKLLKLAGIVLIVCFSSCEVMKIATVNVEYSPKLTFKPGLTTILLIDRFDLSTIKGTQRKKDAIKAGAIGALRYAQNQLAQLPNTKVINIIDSVGLKVNIELIETQAAQYHADYVLALYDFSADIDMAEMNSSTVSYNRSASIKFNLYEANGLFNKKLDGTINEVQADRPSIGLIANLIFTPTVGGNKQAIVLSAEHVTQIALQDYLPYTITNRRPVFNDEVFVPAVTELFAHNYDKADTLLQPLLKNADHVIAGKASYNLAVVYEAEGDIAAAITTVQAGIAKYKNTYLFALLNDLQRE
jgi:hypothetical protein